MRIAFVYDALYPWVRGGAERRFHELGQRLASQHDVHYVSWQWWDGPSTIRRDGVTLHGVGPAPALYGADGKRTVREAVGFSLRVLPAVLRGRFDVIDCSATPYLPLYPTWVGARLSGARLVATWHEFWGDHWDEYLPDRPMVAGVAKALERAGRGLGDRVVAVSPFTARAMGMSDDPRVSVVENGVDARGLASAKPADSPVDALFVGRLIDEKRVDLLIDAIALLAPRFPEVSCAIVGTGPERERLARRATERGVAERVNFLGEVSTPDLRRQLRAARMLVLPSVREGYGMAVAEAQAAGTVPIVVRSPYSGAADLVRDGIDGILVDASAHSVADAIGALLADDPRRVRLSEAARESGAHRDWDEIARRMEDVYAARSAEASTVAGSMPWS
ncbi:MAG: glycosyltransferase family 4 protein [Chloroflexi bacterium]|nr:glycosyltransferase family 4 protein [Chloroflexota bacterium]